ncbi:SEL1-like repeat protein [Candidatus Sumerlaeota bacterium]|nr:SEL1-like repeat protein [Candidatus Sumerlaeota bacterium]
MIFALAFRPAPKNQDESAPETSAPSAATPPSQENPPPSPPATTHSIPSDAGLPQIQWLAAPEEGATISAKSVSLAWQSLSATPPEKYLVGFNAPEPATNLTQTSATFELQNPGAQSVVIIPLGADGLRGRAIERHFVYQPPPDPIREAVALYTGTGGAVDESRAKEIILRASKEVDPLAQMWLGWFLHWGRCGFPKDIDEAVKLSQSAIGSVRSLAESGNADAQFLLGAAFDQGIGIEANPAGAIRWVTQSAEAGQTVAMNYLGWMYVEGRGAPKDNTAAIAWFSRAADLGDTGAMHNLGWMLADGKGVPKDEAKAVEWFRKGAELGSARNMGNLGIFYNKGCGVPKDANAAIEWFQKAARLGDETSQKNLKTLGKEW